MSDNILWAVGSYFAGLFLFFYFNKIAMRGLGISKLKTDLNREVDLIIFGIGQIFSVLFSILCLLVVYVI